MNKLNTSSSHIPGKFKRFELKKPEDSEKNLERRLREAVKRVGGIALKFSSKYSTGLPDRFILLPGGVFVMAEIKTKGKKLGRRQAERIEKARNLGFIVFVIDSEESLQEFIYWTFTCWINA